MLVTEIIKLEPRVKQVLDTAKHQPKRRYYVYDEMKNKLINYVGFYAENPKLKNTNAYEVCITELAKILKI